MQIVKQDKQTKSDVWSNDQYRMIYRDGVRQNFALCTECQALITHKSCYGTGGLLRHRCFRRRNGLMQTHGRGRRTRKSSTPRRSNRIRSSSPYSSSTPVVADSGDDLLTQTRYELETLIQHADASVVFQKPSGTRSSVWRFDLFQLVYRDGERQDFVYCLDCHQLLIHRQQSGTMRLLRHKCIQDRMAQQTEQERHPVKVECEAEVDLKEEEPTKVDEEPIETAQPFFPVPSIFPEKGQFDEIRELTGLEADRCTIARKQLHLMSREFIPISLIQDNEHFQRLVQCLINSAVNFGEFNQRKAWLSQNDVADQQTLRLINVKERLKILVNREKLSFSCDVWQHKTAQICATLRGHYIDDQFKLRNVVLGTRVCLDDDGDLFELCVNILREYTDSRRSALRLLSNATVVVDGERNRHGMQRMINCVSSSLNQIASELIADSTAVQQICTSVTQKLAKDPSPHIRTLLLNFDATHWESIWQLLSVFRELVGTVNCPHEIDDILMMLDPLHEVAQCLGGFNTTTPTINLVYTFRQKLLDVFATALDATSRAIKLKFLTAIKSNFVITDLHRIAVFLDPRFKSLKFFDPDERNRVIEMTKVLISDGTIPPLPLQQPAHAFLAAYMDEGLAVEPSTNEVDVYVRLRLNGVIQVADDDQVLSFWQQRTDLPRLQNLVKQILCIPASCTAQVCHFSASARQMVLGRSRLDVGELDTALLIHSIEDA